MLGRIDSLSRKSVQCHSEEHLCQQYNNIYKHTNTWTKIYTQTRIYMYAHMYIIVLYSLSSISFCCHLLLPRFQRLTCFYSFLDSKSFKWLPAGHCSSSSAPRRHFCCNPSMARRRDGLMDGWMYGWQGQTDCRWRQQPISFHFMAQYYTTVYRWDIPNYSSSSCTS